MCPIVNDRSHSQWEGTQKRDGTIIVLLVVLLSLVLPGVAILVAICGGIYLFVARCKMRGHFRERLGIIGTVYNDCLTHFFCGCCAVCQEGRESMAAGLPMRDFFSGELVDDDRSKNPETGVGTFSKTSILLICTISAVVAVLLLRLIGNGQWTEALCAFFAILQPVVIMFLLTRTSTSSSTPWDLLCKLFAVGFFMTTLQASLIEGILTGVSKVLLLSLLSAEAILSPTASLSSQVFYQQGNPLRESFSDLVKQMIQVSSTGDSSAGPLTKGVVVDFQRATLQAHLGIVIIAMALFSFVVISGVEETLKHFILRCCGAVPQRLLLEPYCVLCCLVIGALGFSTCGTLLSIVFPPESPTTSTVVLFVRGILPIHAICAALQAVRLSQVFGGERSYSIFSVLLPSIFLHGLFDFNLLLFSNLDFIFPPMSGLYAVFLPLSFAILITLGGGWVVFHSLKQISNIRGWERLTDESTHNPSNSLQEGDEA